MRAFIAAISFALTIVIFQSPAEAKRNSKSTKTIVIVKTDEKLKRDMVDLKRELQFFRELARGPSVLGTVPVGLLEPVIIPPVKVAALGPSDVTIETPRDLSLRGVTTDSLPLPLKDTLRKVQASRALDLLG